MSFSQCRNTRNMRHFFFQNSNEFLLHKCRKKFFLFQIWKNVQVQLMSFCYINVETIGKWKNEFFFRISKNAHVFSNEFLLQRYSKKMHKSFLMSFSCKHADRRTYIYPPLDKRYSAIISSICGPNKRKKRIKIKYQIICGAGWVGIFIGFGVAKYLATLIGDERMPCSFMRISRMEIGWSLISS